MRILVIYYSFTGNTRQVATALANELGADICEITCKAYSYGFWGGLTQAFNVLTGGTPPVEIPPQANQNYDILIAAGPVWGARPAPPFRSFIKGLLRNERKLALFLTCDGTSKKYPGEKGLEEIIGAAPQPLIATHLFKRATFEGPDLNKAVATFAQRIQSAAPKSLS